MIKIVQISTAIAVDKNDNPVRHTACVDEDGKAHVLSPNGKAWIRLPEIKED